MSGHAVDHRQIEPDEVETGLERLTGWRRTAFMACCCERMLPNYLKFQTECGFGDPSMLRTGLDAAWRSVGAQTTPKDLHAMIAACDQQAPDTSEFESIYTSAALDAASAIAVTLEAILEPTMDQVREVASLARDTADLLVQATRSLDMRDASFELTILASDLMQAEIQAQLHSIEWLLRDGGEDIPAHVAAFRRACVGGIVLESEDDAKS